MKKILFFALLVSSSAFSVELHPQEECIAMKTNLMAQVGKLQQQNSDLRFSNNFILNSRVPLLYGSIEAGRSNDTAGDNIGDFNQMQIIANGISNTSYQTALTLETQYNQIQSVFSAISSVDCTACPSSSTNCCDFTEILQAIGQVSQRLDTSVYVLSVISNQLNSLEYTNFLLEHGFGVVTNQLDFNNFLAEHGFGSVTNLLFSTSDLDDNVLDVFYYNWLSQNGQLDNSMFSYYVDGITSVADLLRVINYNIAEELPSLNNYNYNWQYRLFPRFSNQLTNSIVAIHRDQTNFFSSLRADINPPHSLSSWSGGSIYEYLTNQYLSAVDASPSNWHSRIETLLAALVFQDSAAREKEIEDEISDGLSDVEGRQSELEGAFDSEESITFLDTENFEKFEMPDIEVGDDQLPDSLVISFAGFTWFEDSYNDQDITIDLTDNDLRDFLTLVRSFFRILWWGAVLLFIWWLFKWFLRFIKWVWSAIKGVDFGV